MKIKNFIIAIGAIALFGLFVIAFSHLLFKNIRSQIVQINIENNMNIIRDINENLKSYLSHQKSILEHAVKKYDFLDSKNANKIKLAMSEIFENNEDFDVLQILYENSDFYASNKTSFTKIPLASPDKQDIFTLDWYKNTKDSQSAQIHSVLEHGMLLKSTINISAPIIENGKFIGALAGVITIENFINKLLHSNTSENIHVFLVFNNNAIIFGSQDSEIQSEIRQAILQNDQHIFMSDLVLGIYKLGFYVDASKINRYLNNILKYETIVSLVVVAIFMLIFLLYISIYFYYRKRLASQDILMNVYSQQSAHGIILFKENHTIGFINKIAKDFLDSLKISDIFSFINDEKEIINHNDKSYLITRIPLHKDFQFEGMAIIIEDITQKEQLKKMQQKNEYILIHQAKMIEMGELVGGINHQIKQPINCLSVLIGNILHFKENDMLDDELLIKNLKLCQDQIINLDKTIGLYSNYYSSNYQKTRFNLYECICDAVNIISIAKHIKTHSKSEITILGNKDIMIDSIENIIVQIMLILLSNSMDAIKTSDKKEITITLEENKSDIIIYVKDYGSGVNEEMLQDIFSEIKTTKENGVGIGLYFAKRISNSKLNGDIRLINAKDPTVFALIINKGENNE